MPNLCLLYWADFCRKITTTLRTPMVGVKQLIKTVVAILRLLLENAVITVIGVERHVRQNPTQLNVGRMLDCPRGQNQHSSISTPAQRRSTQLIFQIQMRAGILYFTSWLTVMCRLKVRYLLTRQGGEAGFV